MFSAFIGPLLSRHALFFGLVSFCCVPQKKWKWIIVCFSWDIRLTQVTPYDWRVSALHRIGHGLYRFRSTKGEVESGFRSVDDDSAYCQRKVESRPDWRDEVTWCGWWRRVDTEDGYHDAQSLKDAELSATIRLPRKMGSEGKKTSNEQVDRMEAKRAAARYAQELVEAAVVLTYLVFKG